MGLVISALVTFWVGFLIYKKYKPQPVLFLGGMILMYIAAIFGYGTILPAKAATGSTFSVSYTHLTLPTKRIV